MKLIIHNIERLTMEEKIVCVRVANDFINSDHKDCLYVSDINNKEVVTSFKRGKESISVWHQETKPL